MKDSQRKLLRAFYQSIPTQGEKDAFYAVMGMSKEDRLAYIARALENDIAIDKATVQAILAVSSLTKEDRVMIFSGIARQMIFKFFAWLGF